MLVKRAAAALLERRSAEWGSSSDIPPPGGWQGGGVDTAGTAVNERTALQVAAVYGSVSVIANAVSTLPLELFSSSIPATKRLLPPGPLLTQPYQEISRIDWLKQYVMSMALRGNFYGHIIERDGDLFPSQIKPEHPDDMGIRRVTLRDGSRRLEYRIRGKVIPNDDIFHIRHMSVPGALVGLNPIEYLRLTLGLARAQDLYGGAFFNNSARPDVVLESDEDLNDEEVRRLAASWRDSQQGIGAAHMPAVASGGVKVKVVSINPEDAQFLESREFSQATIAGMIFHVPLHMVGLVSKSTSWGTGIAQQEQGFVTNTLMGYLAPLEEGITAIGPRDGRINKFNVKKRMRGDPLQRMQTAALGIASSVLCPDEAREDEDLPPIPGGLGKTFLVPINSQTIKQAVSETMNPATTPPPAGEQQDGGANA